MIVSRVEGPYVTQTFWFLIFLSLCLFCIITCLVYKKFFFTDQWRFEEFQFFLAYRARILSMSARWFTSTRSSPPDLSTEARTVSYSDMAKSIWRSLAFFVNVCVFPNVPQRFSNTIHSNQSFGFDCFLLRRRRKGEDTLLSCFVSWQNHLLVLDGPSTNAST